MSTTILFAGDCSCAPCGVCNSGGECVTVNATKDYPGFIGFQDGSSGATQKYLNQVVSITSGPFNDCGEPFPSPSASVQTSYHPLFADIFSFILTCTQYDQAADGTIDTSTGHDVVIRNTSIANGPDDFCTVTDIIAPCCGGNPDAPGYPAGDCPVNPCVPGSNTMFFPSDCNVQIQNAALGSCPASHWNTMGGGCDMTGATTTVVSDTVKIITWPDGASVTFTLSGPYTLAQCIADLWQLLAATDLDGGESTTFPFDDGSTDPMPTAYLVYPSKCDGSNPNLCVSCVINSYQRCNPFHATTALDGGILHAVFDTSLFDPLVPETVGRGGGLLQKNCPADQFGSCPSSVPSPCSPDTLPCDVVNNCDQLCRAFILITSDLLHLVARKSKCCFPNGINCTIQQPETVDPTTGALTLGTAICTTPSLHTSAAVEWKIIPPDTGLIRYHEDDIGGASPGCCP